MVPAPMSREGTPNVSTLTNRQKALAASVANSQGNGVFAEYALAASRSTAAASAATAASSSLDSLASVLGFFASRMPTCGHPYAEQPRFSTQHSAWKVSPQDGQVVVFSLNRIPL